MNTQTRKKLERQYIAFIKAGGACTLANFIANATAKPCPICGKSHEGVCPTGISILTK